MSKTFENQNLTLRGTFIKYLSIFNNLQILQNKILHDVKGILKSNFNCRFSKEFRKEYCAKLWLIWILKKTRMMVIMTIKNTNPTWKEGSKLEVRKSKALREQIIWQKSPCYCMKSTIKKNELKNVPIKWIWTFGKLPVLVNTHVSPYFFNFLCCRRNITEIGIDGILFKYVRTH